MPLKSTFKAGDSVRLNLPGSKLHGVTGTLKAPRPPAGWWLVIADSPLEQPEGEALDGELARSFIAPDLWLLPHPQGATAGIRGEALPPSARCASCGGSDHTTEGHDAWLACAAERMAVLDAQIDAELSALCPHVTASKRRCTRPAGHTGRHATHGAKGLRGA